MYNMILAYSGKNLGIGNKGTLPWPTLKEDMEFFVKHTKGAPLVCSSTTYLSLPNQVQKRVTIIQTNNYKPEYEGKVIVSNITPEYLDYHYRLTRRPPMVIGGSSMFNTRLAAGEHCIFTTEVDEEYVADTFIDISFLNKLKSLPTELVQITDTVPKMTMRKHFAKLY